MTIDEFENAIRKGLGRETALIDAAALEDGNLHTFVLDLFHVVERMPKSDRPRFLEWAYEHSPCSFCRESAVRNLTKLGPLAPWLRAEALHDAEPDIRAAAAQSPA